MQSDDLPPIEIVDYSESANGHSRRRHCNNSPLTALNIITSNERNVLGNRRLELNEMTGTIELGREPLTDDDEFEIRTNIEDRFFGGLDSHGNEKGLKLSGADIHAACARAARLNCYHPVRDYLGRLKWDGVARLADVCEDLLGAQRTELNQLLVRKWFISAVARALRPGCKVDTALVLVGKQGVGKSTFFREIASPWYIDTSIDLGNKDSFQILRRGWVVEWSELETMRRAKDVAAVKSFLSTQVDSYRPPYGRNPVDVPRGCVIVGTTNNEEFLTDDTGNRRFWPITVGETDIAALRDSRDQLWAEAVALYCAKEDWWLSETESVPLATVHHDHESDDPWTETVLDFARTRLVEFRTAEVLESMSGDKMKWGHSEKMRVASILKRAGYRQGKKPEGRSRAWMPK